MSMQVDLIFTDDDAIRFRTHCTACSFRSVPYDDEDMAAAAWFGHACVRVGSVPQTGA